MLSPDRLLATAVALHDQTAHVLMRDGFAVELVLGWRLDGGHAFTVAFLPDHMDSATFVRFAPTTVTLFPGDAAGNREALALAADRCSTVATAHLKAESDTAAFWVRTFVSWPERGISRTLMSRIPALGHAPDRGKIGDRR